MSDYSKQIDADNERKINKLLNAMPQFCKLYFDDAKRAKQTRTRLGYARDIKRFFDWLQSTAGYKHINLLSSTVSILDHLTFEDFEEYKKNIEFSNKTDSKGNNFLTENTTMARRLSALRSFMKFYYSIGMIKNNPAMFISMPKVFEKNIITLNQNEVDTILDAITSNVGLTPNQIKRRKLTEKRDIAIMFTLLGTGIRVSELVGLDVDSIDFHNARILITLKGGNEGYAYFGENVENALRDYIDNGRDILSPSDKALFISTKQQKSLKSKKKGYNSLLEQNNCVPLPPNYQ